jgi:hypothetical protein
MCWTAERSFQNPFFYESPELVPDACFILKTVNCKFPHVLDFRGHSLTNHAQKGCTHFDLSCFGMPLLVLASAV